MLLNSLLVDEDAVKHNRCGKRDESRGQRVCKEVLARLAVIKAVRIASETSILPMQFQVNSTGVVCITTERSPITTSRHYHGLIRRER